jgi:hypothetical protein
VFTCQNGLLFLFFCPLFSVGSLSFTLAHNGFALGVRAGFRRTKLSTQH